MWFLPAELVEEIVTRIPYDCLSLVKNLDSHIWGPTIDEHLAKRRTIRFFLCYFCDEDAGPYLERDIFYTCKFLKNPSETLPFERMSLFHSSVKRFTSLETFACNFVGCRRVKNYVSTKHYHLAEATDDDLFLAFRMFPVTSQRVTSPVPQRFSVLMLNMLTSRAMLTHEFWRKVPSTFQFIRLMLYLPRKNYPIGYIEEFLMRVVQTRRNVALYIDTYSDKTKELSPQRRRLLVDLFLQPQSKYVGFNARHKDHNFELEDFQRIAQFWNSNDEYEHKELVVPVKTEDAESIALMFQNSRMNNMGCKIADVTEDMGSRALYQDVFNKFMRIELFNERYHEMLLPEQRLHDKFWEPLVDYANNNDV